MYEYDARVVRVVDGDTVVFEVTKTFELPVDFGFYVRDTIVSRRSAQVTFRLRGINAPEPYGVTKDAGLRASKALSELLSVGTIRVVSYKADSFGRWLADVFVTLPDGSVINICEKMLLEGHAVPYRV